MTDQKLVVDVKRKAASQKIATRSPLICPAKGRPIWVAPNVSHSSGHCQIEDSNETNLDYGEAAHDLLLQTVIEKKVDMIPLSERGTLHLQRSWTGTASTWASRWQEQGPQ